MLKNNLFYDEYIVNIYLVKKIDQLFGSLLIWLLSSPKKSTQFLLPVKSILIIRPGGIGDAVLLIPAIKFIKEKFPDCRIDVLAEERNSQIFKLCSDVGQVYHYDHLQELCFCLKTKYDVVVDTEQWHRLSAVVARLIRAKFRIGFGTNERQRMFSHTVDYSQAKYELDSFLDLFSPLNIGKSHSYGSFLSIPEESFKSSAVFLNSVLSTSFIVLFPGASIPERRWGKSKFRALAGKILASGLAVVVVGGEEDVDLARDICLGLEVLNLAGKTSLLESAAVIAQSKIVVTGDSGLLHIAVGLDKPTISLFGPGIAKKWAPRGEKHVVINKELTCSPCTRFGNTPKCPYNASCLQKISVNEVFQAVERLIESEYSSSVKDL